ncbi:MAG: hypothetical protein ACR2OM_13725 [Aestuariivirgaceae bacterium]
MKKLLAICAVTGLALVATVGYATMPWQIATAGDKLYAQEDCAEGETWNEETQKCDKPE